MVATDHQDDEAGMKGGHAELTRELRRVAWHTGRDTNALRNRRYVEHAYVRYWLGPTWARRMAGHFFA